MAPLDNKLVNMDMIILGEKVKDYFMESDLSIVNLETSITTRGGNKWPNKQFNFKSNPKT